MAGDRIDIRISAQDGASPVFKAVGASAAAAGAQLATIGSKGAASLNAFEAEIGNVGNSLRSELSGAAVSIDTGNAVGQLQGVQTAAQSLETSLSGIGTGEVSIDTTGAVGDLHSVENAVQGVEASVGSVSGTPLTISISGTLGDLQSVEIALTGVASSIGAVSGTPLDISTDGAVGDLHSIESAAQGVEASIGVLSTVQVSIDTTGAVGNLQSIEIAVTSVVSSIGTVNGTPLTVDTAEAESNVDSLSQKVLALGATLATAGAGVAAFVKSMGLESALANVNSIANVSKSELDSLKGTILDLSVQLGVAPTGLADGLYDVVSSGFEANGAIEILTKSAIAAKAGLTDTATAVRAITAVLNAYGEGADQAGNVSDVLFQIVNSGVITFEQLANNMGSVLPLASTLKVSIQELGAAYAALTLKGVNASAAETEIAALMRSAIQPTTAMTEALKKYGYESGETLIRSQGLAGYLKFLNEASGGTAAGMLKLTGNVEAGNAAMSLGANNGAGYTAMLKDMDGAAKDGATTLGVFAIQSATTQQSLDKLSASFGRFQISMGDAVSGPVASAADGLSGLLNGISSLPGPIQAVIGGVTTLAGTLAVVGGALTLIGPGIGTLVSGLGTLAGALGLTSAAATSAGVAIGTVALPLVAIGGTIAAGIYLWKEYNNQLDGVRGSFQKLEAQEKSYLDAGNHERADAVKKAVTDLHAMEDIVNNALKIGENGPNIPVPTDSQYEKVINAISKVMADSTIDIIAYQKFLDAEFAKIAADPGHATKYLDEILVASSGKMTQFKTKADATGKSSEDMATRMAAAGHKIQSSINKDLQTAIDATAEIQKAQREQIAQGMKLMGMDNPLDQINLANVGTQYTQLAGDIMNANVALQSGFQVIVGNTDAIARQAQGVADWTDKMIGAVGTTAVLDEAVQRWVTAAGDDQEKVNAAWEHYNNIQTAGTRILTANTAIQEHIQDIQLNQTGVIADLMEGQEKYLAQLSEVPAAQQLVALGWMDANEAAKANQVITMAAAAANNELGASGKAATEQMIIGAAQADPVLKAMLADMKLISVGADGTITVNFDQAKGANDAINQLNTTILTLADILDDGSINGSIDIAIKGREELNEVTKQLQDAGGKTVTTTVKVAQQGAKAVQTDMTGIKQVMTDIGSMAVETSVSLNDNGIGGELSRIGSMVDDLSGKTAVVTVDFQTAGSDLIGQVGNIAGNVVIPTTPAPITETPPYEAAPVTVPVEIQLGSNALGSAQSAASAALGGVGDTLAIPAKVGPIDTSELDAITDKTITITVNTVLNDTTGILGGFATGEGAASVEAKVVPVTITTTLDDTTGLLGDDAAALNRTLTVNVEKNDPTGLLGSFDQHSGDAIASADITRTLTVKVVADDPQGLLGGGEGAGPVDALSSDTRTITINAVDNTDGIIDTLNDATIDDKNFSIFGDATVGLAAVENVNGAAVADKNFSIFGDATVGLAAVNNVNGATVADKSFSIFGDATIALAAINNVNNTAVADKTMTINVVTAYSTIGSPSAGGGTYVRHGGIPGFANGGVLFEAGEAGREMAHFASGGMALIPDHRMYIAPPATYISPANAVPQGNGMGDLPPIHITIAGNVYGLDDLEAKVGGAVYRALANNGIRHKREQGMRI